MKLVVSFYGMCLCVLEGQQGRRARRATVLLLNGAAAPRSAASAVARPRLPYHHPLLFVPAAHADRVERPILVAVRTDGSGARSTR